MGLQVAYRAPRAAKTRKVVSVHKAVVWVNIASTMMTAGPLLMTLRLRSTLAVQADASNVAATLTVVTRMMNTEGTARMGASDVFVLPARNMLSAAQKFAYPNVTQISKKTLAISTK